ncbi:MAG: hypothetical protein GY920_09975 [Aliivibrio sp.]|nr:hypothetical protein [Aliivibrio sp.]
MNSFDSKDVMETVSKETIRTADFFKLDEVPMQRNHTLRAKKVAKELTSSFLPTGLEVSIVEYSNGKRQILNGNTRKHVWMHYDNYGVKAPSHLFATVYKVDSKNMVRSLYYSIDSSVAVENSKHKIQGYCRELGIELTDRKFMTGTFTKALEAIAAHYVTEDGDYINGNMKAIISEFKDEIVALDTLGISGSNISNQPLIAACLMVLKKYGAHNKKVWDMLVELKNGHGNRTGSECDGLFFIKYELPTRLGDTWGKTDGVSLPSNLNLILYCLDKYLDGTMFSKIGCTKDRYFETFWED